MGDREQNKISRNYSVQRKIKQEKNNKNSGRGQEKNIEKKRYVAKAKTES